MPDSIKEIPPEEYSEKGVRDVDFRKFDELPSRTPLDVPERTAPSAIR
jgi:hypothetical protein